MENRKPGKYAKRMDDKEYQNFKEVEKMDAGYILLAGERERVEQEQLARYL